MKRLYGTTEPTDADMLRLMLEREDIPVHLQNKRGSMHATFLPTPATEIDILVPESREEEAEAVLEEYLNNRITPDDPESIKSRGQEQWIRLKWLLVFVLFGGPSLMMLSLTFPLQLLSLRGWAVAVLAVGNMVIILYLLYRILSHSPQTPAD